MNWSERALVSSMSSLVQNFPSEIKILFDKVEILQ